jgi:hypothetical protein
MVPPPPSQHWNTDGSFHAFIVDEVCEAKMGGLEREQKVLESALHNHGKRLTALERFRWMQTGVIVAIGTVASFIGSAFAIWRFLEKR